MSCTTLSSSMNPKAGPAFSALPPMKSSKKLLMTSRNTPPNPMNRLAPTTQKLYALDLAHVHEGEGIEVHESNLTFTQKSAVVAGVPEGAACVGGDHDHDHHHDHDHDHDHGDEEEETSSTSSTSSSSSSFSVASAYLILLLGLLW